MAGAGTVPAFGRPTCKEWWEGDGSTDGLQERFKDQLRLTSKLEDLIGTFGPDLTEAQKADMVSKTLVTNTGLHVMPAVRAAESESYGTGGIIAWVAKVFSWISLQVVKPALPFTQAILLMGIAVFMGPVMVLSRYSLEMMVWGGMTIFTVKFWTFMWFLADFMDDGLSKALYPAHTIATAVGSGPTNSAGNGSKESIAALVLMTMYLGLPSLWSAMMTIAGSNIGSAIGSAKAEMMKSATMASGVGGKAARFAGKLF
jgi:hypothetical protein